MDGMTSHNFHFYLLFNFLIEKYTNAKLSFEILGSHWFDIGCIYAVSCQFNAMPNNNELSFIFTERAKLGPNDNWATSFGEMASHFEIFRMLFDANRSGKANSKETSSNNGME